MSIKNITVAEFLTKHINESDKSQTEISKILGYSNPNIITMFKQGRTKLPLTKIAEMAAALEIDPIYMMKVVMSEYSPETWKTLERVLGRSLISEAEHAAVKVIREEVGDLEGAKNFSSKIDDLRSLAQKWKLSDQEPDGKVIRH